LSFGRGFAIIDREAGGGMKRLLSLIAVMPAAAMLNCALAVAEPDQTSANYWMPACRDAASLNLYGDNSGEPETIHVFKMGFCAGLINGITYMKKSIGVCQPDGVSTQQATQVVVQYIDKRPERINENFKLLAVEALQAAWPCPRR
jgi:Rap1a immunity proteins